MRGLTFGIAALLIAVPLAPAQALDRNGVRSGGSVRVQSGFGGGDRHDGRRDHRRSDRSQGDVFISDWGYDDWDGGRPWESDSYNDWWHDRPDRAFPRWVQNNQNCERIWSSGAGWRC